MHAAAPVPPLPFHSWHHAAIVPAGHPLAGMERLSLDAIAEYPVVTYHGAGRHGRNVRAGRAGAGPDQDLC
jgi:LysR family transcriptional regulator, cys regulon transcriptional activator